MPALRYRAKPMTKGFTTEGGMRFETVSKAIFPRKCNSERSEDSSIFKYLDPSLTLRVTEKIGFETVPFAFPPYPLKII